MKEKEIEKEVKPIEEKAKDETTEKEPSKTVITGTVADLKLPTLSESIASSTHHKVITEKPPDAHKDLVSKDKTLNVAEADQPNEKPDESSTSQ